jgi:hypothetical protein
MEQEIYYFGFCRIRIELLWGIKSLQDISVIKLLKLEPLTPSINELMVTLIQGHVYKAESNHSWMLRILSICRHMYATELLCKVAEVKVVISINVFSSVLMKSCIENSHCLIKSICFIICKLVLLLFGEFGDLIRVALQKLLISG